MRYLLAEAKIALPWGVLLVVLAVVILRLTKVVSPELPNTWDGWVAFLEFVYPVLLPLLVFNLLEQDKRWRTREIMAVAPRRKSVIYLVRTAIVALPVFLVAVAAVRPQEYLFLLAPGLALGGLCLLVGIVWNEEMGLGLALGWWGISVAALIAGVGAGGVGRWLLLVQGTAALAPGEPSMPKWFHLGLGCALIVLALIMAERRRTWTRS